MEIDIVGPFHKKTPDNTITHTLKYWALILEFMLENQGYEELIEVMEQIKLAQVSVKKHEIFYRFYLKKITKAINILEDCDEEQNEKLDAIFESLKSFPIVYDSEEYLKLFDSLTKFNTTWPNFLQFMDWHVNKIPLKIQVKKLPMRKFDYEINVNQGYYLFYAESIISNYINGNKSIDNSSKKEKNQISRFLKKLSEFNSMGLCNGLTLEYEMKIRLISGSEEDNFQFFTEKYKKGITNCQQWDFIISTFEKSPNIQLNFLCQTYKIHADKLKKISILRKIYSVYLQLNQRPQAKSTSEIILSYCTVHNIEPIKSDFYTSTIDDLFSKKCSQEELIEEFRANANKAMESIRLAQCPK
jgi:hypothetical protein